MKRIFIAFLLVAPLLGIAQLEYGIQGAVNAPIKYQNAESARKLGAELQFQLTKPINDAFTIETGLMVDAYGRVDKKEEDFRGNASFMTLAFYLPFIAKQNIFSKKFTIRYGIMFALRNCLTFTKYTGINPEEKYSSEYYPNIVYLSYDDEVALYPAPRTYGIDFTIGAQYNVTENIGVLCNYHSPFNFSDNNYGLLSLGMNYTFGKNKSNVE